MAKVTWDKLASHLDKTNFHLEQTSLAFLRAAKSYQGLAQCYKEAKEYADKLYTRLQAS